MKDFTALTYYDTEHDTIISGKDLFVNYINQLGDGEIEDDTTFPQYVDNALTKNNGILEIVSI